MYHLLARLRCHGGLANEYSTFLCRASAAIGAKPSIYFRIGSQELKEVMKASDPLHLVQADFDRLRTTTNDILGTRCSPLMHRIGEDLASQWVGVLEGIRPQLVLLRARYANSF